MLASLTQIATYLLTFIVLAWTIMSFLGSKEQNVCWMLKTGPRPENTKHIWTLKNERLFFWCLLLHTMCEKTISRVLCVYFFTFSAICIQLGISVVEYLRLMRWKKQSKRQSNLFLTKASIVMSLLQQATGMELKMLWHSHGYSWNTLLWSTVSTCSEWVQSKAKQKNVLPPQNAMQLWH